MVVKKSPKISKTFYCKSCDYICSKQSEFNKHMVTAKHKMIVNGSKKISKISKTNNNEYECVCGKTYKYDSGYYRHKKTCRSINLPVDSNSHVKEDVDGSVNNTTTTMMELIRQNQEFKELIVEQNKHLLELSQKPTTTNNTINNNNQKFNLNFFLNEQCKDAINMSEFLENMTLDIEDLTETGRLGYVGGISRIFINKLREMDTYKRPLHCTDLKRETLYIRENDEWFKENDSKKKFNDIIAHVANKNCKTIKQWTEEHPNYNQVDTQENIEYVMLCQAMLGGFGEQENRQHRDRIVRNLIKEVIVNKC